MKIKIIYLSILTFIIMCSSCSTKHTMTNFTYDMNYRTYDVYKNKKGYYILEADEKYKLTKLYFPKGVFDKHE